MHKHQIKGVFSSNSFTALLDFSLQLDFMIPQSGTNAIGFWVSVVSKFPVTQGSLYFQHYISVLFSQFLFVFPQV